MLNSTTSHVRFGFGNGGELGLEQRDGVSGISNPAFACRCGGRAGIGISANGHPASVSSQLSANYGLPIRDVQNF